MPLINHKELDRIMVDAIAAVLAGRTEPYTANVTVGVFYPRRDKPEERKLPFVGVAWDSTVNLPAWNASKAQVRGVVRITVSAAQPTDAKLLALLVEGLALDISNEDVTRVRSNTGTFVAVDPDNGNNLASFTLRVTASLTQS